MNGQKNRQNMIQKNTLAHYIVTDSQKNTHTDRQTNTEANLKLKKIHFVVSKRGVNNKIKPNSKKHDNPKVKKTKKGSQ